MAESWIRTFTGLKFDPFHPDPKAICIEDIAHALACQNRFSGHTRYPYSVAQHSFAVSRLVPKHMALQGLLHDASEAYIVDIPSPIKHQPALALYRDLEESVMGAISERFELGPDKWWHNPEIRKADAIMGATEARDLMIGWEEFPSREAWAAAGGPEEKRIEERDWREVEVVFQLRFAALCLERYSNRGS